MRAILFDCDGTLADSFAIIVGTMVELFRENGLPEPMLSDVHAIIGLSLGTAIARLLPEHEPAEIERLTERYRTLFHRLRNDPAFEERLFEGVGPMLRELQTRDDLRLGMVTGKSRRGVRIIVESHRLEGVFGAVRTADDCPSKPDPAMVLECCAELGVPPGQTLVVGDSVYDMAMAVAAGAAGIGVSWGSASPQALREAGAHFVAATMDELRGELRRWADEPAMVA